MSLKVAVVSTDGKFCDLHFGRAEAFYIYSIEDGVIGFLEKRNLDQISSHSDDELKRVYGLLSDCRAVVASRVGFPVATYLISKGLRVFESEFAVSDILNKFMKEHTFESE